MKNQKIEDIKQIARNNIFRDNNTHIPMCLMEMQSICYLIDQAYMQGQIDALKEVVNAKQHNPT